MPEHRSVAVIGGTGGIGSATVREFAEHGWRVGFTFARSQAEASKLRRVVNKLGATAASFRLDLVSPRTCDSFVRALSRYTPKLDAVVFCQAVLTGKPLQHQSLREIQRAVQVNLVGTVYLTRQLLPKMARGSSLTYVSSISAFAGSHDPVYAATKGALVSFCKSIARAQGPRIRANAVAPGLIEDTSMARRMDARVKERHRSSTSLQRLGTPVDVARAVYFLASESGRHITGTTLDVNGGEYLR